MCDNASHENPLSFIHQISPYWRGWHDPCELIQSELGSEYTMTKFKRALIIMAFSILTAASALPLHAKIAGPNRSVEYKVIGDTRLNLHIFNPEGFKPSDKRAAIVFFFGGGWSGGTPAQFYQQARGLADLGMVAISAEYRVRSRHKTTPFECVKDGKSAIRWVRQHAQELGIDPERIVAAGGSAGGHVAACTALIEGHEEDGEDASVSVVPNAMILFNPVIDTTEKGYGISKVGKERKTEISPCHHVRKGLPPTLVFHGTADEAVPIENVQRFTRLMKEAGNQCTLVAFEDKRHGFFNGSWFRPNSNDIDFKLTMEKSIAFITDLGFLDEPENQR